MSFKRRKGDNAETLQGTLMIESQARQGFTFGFPPGTTTESGLDFYPSKRFSGNDGIFLLSVTARQRTILPLPHAAPAQVVLQYLDDQDKITRSLLIPLESLL